MTEFLCDTFSLWCADHGEYVTHAAPEIDALALGLAVALVMGGLAIAMDYGRGRRRRLSTACADVTPTQRAVLVSLRRA